jgi:hypothetical protein
LSPEDDAYIKECEELFKEAETYFIGQEQEK